MIRQCRVNPVAELKGVTLSSASSGKLGLPGDPPLIAQAISNLIDNALKYGQKSSTIAVVATQRADKAIETPSPTMGPASKTKKSAR
jgi:hypothetical protein